MKTWSEVKWEKIHLQGNKEQEQRFLWRDRNGNYENRGIIVWTHPQGSVGATTLAAAAQDGKMSTSCKVGGGWIFEPMRFLASGL
jgi:hypothetical protein